MYEIERPHGCTSAQAPARNLVIHMRENRSHLGNEARGAMLALALAMMAAGIFPALQGHLFVPVAALTGLALLTFALDLHTRSRPAREWLEINQDVVRHRDGRGRQTELPLGRVRLCKVGREDANLRLFVEARHGRFEIGTCLGLGERRELAGLIGDTLADLQRDRRVGAIWA